MLIRGKIKFAIQKKTISNQINRTFWIGLHNTLQQTFPPGLVGLAENVKCQPLTYSLRGTNKDNL